MIELYIKSSCLLYSELGQPEFRYPTTSSLSSVNPAGFGAPQPRRCQAETANPHPPEGSGIDEQATEPPNTAADSDQVKQDGHLNLLTSPFAVNGTCTSASPTIPAIQSRREKPEQHVTRLQRANIDAGKPAIDPNNGQSASTAAAATATVRQPAQPASQPSTYWSPLPSICHPCYPWVNTYRDMHGSPVHGTPSNSQMRYQMPGDPSKMLPGVDIRKR